MNLNRCSRPFFRLGLLALLPVLGFSANLNVYFGNLHSHTSYSDGSGTPKEAFKYAREVGDLDFLAVTEHNHKAAEQGDSGADDGRMIATMPWLYNGKGKESLISAARAATADGTFVAIYGQEFSTIGSGNHANVFEINEVIPTRNGHYEELLDWLGTRPDSQNESAIIQFNHPATSKSKIAIEYGRQFFGSDANWVKTLGAHVKTIEVLNGPGTSQTASKPENFEKQYWEFLNYGFHAAPVANQDNHWKTWGTLTGARTAVICEQLTKKDILAAIRSRHVYATDEPGLRIVGKIGERLFGEEIARPSGELNLTLQIENDNHPNGNYTIEVFADKYGGDVADVIKTVSFEGNGTVDIKGISAGNYDYIAIKLTRDVEQGEDKHAWLAPVWFN